MACAGTQPDYSNNKATTLHILVPHLDGGVAKVLAKKGMHIQYRARGHE
jgi:hypothetical protein